MHYILGGTKVALPAKAGTKQPNFNPPPVAGRPATA